MRNRRSVETCVARLKRLALQHRLLPSMPSATYLFFNNNKKSRQKNAALKRRGVLCTAQIAFVTGRHALACKVSCKREVGCETPWALCAMDLSDGLLGWHFAMASLNAWVTSRESFAGVEKTPAPQDEGIAQHKDETRANPLCGSVVQMAG